MVFFFKFSSVASKQNLFGFMAFCQFWVANDVTSGEKK